MTELDEARERADRMKRAVEDARRENAALKLELSELRLALQTRRRELKNIVVTWGTDTERGRLAKDSLKRSRDPLDRVIGTLEDQVSRAMSGRERPDTVEFSGDVVGGKVSIDLRKSGSIVNGSTYVTFEKPSPEDKYWVYVKGIYDQWKGQIAYDYASRLTVAALKELPDGFKAPPKPGWWAHPG